MINENTVIMILTWLKEKKTEAGNSLESEISKGNKPNHDHFRGREVAYSNSTTFIETLTGIRIEDEKNSKT